MGTEADTQIGVTHFSQGSTSRDSSSLPSPSAPRLEAFSPEWEERPKWGKDILALKFYVTGHEFN